MTEGVVPAHGHGLVRPWQPGQSGNPGGRPRELAAALALARRSSSEMVAKLLDLARTSPDDRVQAMAATKLLELAGVQHLSATPEASSAPIGLSQLTPEERRALCEALRPVGRLMRLRAALAAEQGALPPDSLATATLTDTVHDTS